MIPAYEINTCFLDEFPDLGGLEMINFVLVCSGQVGAHRAVVARYDDTTAARGVCRGGEVFGAYAGRGAGIAEGGGVFVVAYAPDVKG